MHWFNFFSNFFATGLIVQWTFLCARYVIREMRDDHGQLNTPLTGTRVLVVFGREVHADGVIEERFACLLLQAVRLVNSGRYDKVVVLGGDHHGNGVPYAVTARARLMSYDLTDNQIWTPCLDSCLYVRNYWAFSASQELATARRLFQLGADVTMLGESQRWFRYQMLMIALGCASSMRPISFIPSSESVFSWIVGLAVTIIDPCEAHILWFVQRIKFKRLMVGIRDAQRGK
jgi:hypothetical protein